VEKLPQVSAGEDIDCLVEILHTELDDETTASKLSKKKIKHSVADSYCQNETLNFCITLYIIQ